MAGKTIAHPQLQVVEPGCVAHELLIADGPRCRYRREESPLVVGAKLGGTIGASRESDAVSVGIVVAHSPHKRGERGPRAIAASAFPQSECTCLYVVDTNGIVVEIGRGGEESAVGVALGLGKCQCIDVVKSKGLVISERDISKQLLGLGGATVGLSMCPDAGWQELLTLRLGVAVSAKYRKVKPLCQSECQFGVSAYVSCVVFSAAVHESHGVIDLVTVGKSVISSVCVFCCLKCGVECSGRVKRLLYIIDGSSVLEYAPKHAHINLKQSVPHVLIHAHVACEVARLLVQDYACMVHISKRHAVAIVLSTAAKGDVMVLNEGRLLDSSLPIGVESMVDEHESPSFHLTQVVAGVEHVKVFEHLAETITPVVVDGCFSRLPLFGDNLNYTRGTSRTILCRLAGVLENVETLDIGGINR